MLTQQPNPSTPPLKQLQLSPHPQNVSYQNTHDTHCKNRYKSLRFLVLLAMCYNLSSFYFGYSMVYFNAIPYTKLQQLFDINMGSDHIDNTAKTNNNNNQKQWYTGIGEGVFTGCIPFGALFGSLFSRAFIARFTRKQSFYVGNGLAMFAGILVLFRFWPTLLIARLIQGFCVGFYSALTPIMVKQMSPTELSGSFGAFLSPAIGLGFLLAYSFPYILDKYNIFPLQVYWRLTFGLSLITLALQTYLLQKVFNYQTPKYLIMKNKRQQCMQVIKMIYCEQFWEEVINEKIADFECQNRQNKSEKQGQRQMHEIQLSSDRKKRRNSHQDINESPNPPHLQHYQQSLKPKLPNIQLKPKQYYQLQQQNQPHQVPDSSPPQITQHNNPTLGLNNPSSHSNSRKYPKDNPLAVLFAFCLPTFQQFSGINVIITFGSQLAHGSMPSLEKQLPLIINAQKLVFAVLAVFLLRRFGRKTLLVGGTFIVFISLFLIFIGFITQDQNIKNVKQAEKNKYLLLFAFLLYISSFVPTMGPITWLYMPEVVQPTIVPYAAMTHWIIAFIIVTLFPVIRQNSANPGCPYLFLFFSISTLIYFFVAYLVMVETKDKSEHQIREQYALKLERIKSAWDRIRLK